MTKDEQRDALRIENVRLIDENTALKAQPALTWEAAELREQVTSWRNRAERFERVLREIAAVPGQYRGSVEAVKAMYAKAQGALND